MKWAGITVKAPNPGYRRMPVIPVAEHKEFRCPECNHLLAKGELGSGGSMQFKCSNGCKRLVTFARM